MSSSGLTPSALRWAGWTDGELALVCEALHQRTPAAISAAAAAAPRHRDAMADGVRLHLLLERSAANELADRGFGPRPDTTGADVESVVFALREGAIPPSVVPLTWSRQAAA